LLLISIGLTSCKRTPAPPTAHVPPPVGLIPISQQFEFSDQSVTNQGTGFLARTPGGHVVCLTSAHFLNREGPRMVRAKLSLRETGASLGETTKSFGLPGEAPDDGINSIYADRRADYLAFWLSDQRPHPEGSAEPLALDDRKTIPEGERVWLPFVDYQNGRQQTLEEGTVVRCAMNWTMVDLRERLTHHQPEHRPGNWNAFNVREQKPDQTLARAGLRHPPGLGRSRGRKQRTTPQRQHR
jgi:hypothetical protein